MDRGGIVRAGQALVRFRILQVHNGKVDIQQKSRWNTTRVRLNEREDAGHLWISHEKHYGKAMTGIIASDDERHRFSVERKTGVKTIQKRRRGGGYVDNSRAENDVVRELMNFYSALKGKALSPDEAARFSDSAQALLDACSGNLQEAKALLRQSFAKPET